LLASDYLVPTHPATKGLKAVTLKNFTAYHFDKSNLNSSKITACSKNIYELGNPPVSVQGQFRYIYIYFHTPSPSSYLRVSSAATRPPWLPRKLIAAPKGTVQNSNPDPSQVCETLGMELLRWWVLSTFFPLASATLDCEQAAVLLS